MSDFMLNGMQLQVFTEQWADSAQNNTTNTQKF